MVRHLGSPSPLITLAMNEAGIVDATIDYFEHSHREKMGEGLCMAVRSMQPLRPQGDHAPPGEHDFRSLDTGSGSQAGPLPP